MHSGAARRYVCALFIGLFACTGSVEAAHIKGRLKEILSDTYQESRIAHAESEWSHLQAFYASRDYSPVWVDEPGPIPKAKQFVQILSQAHREGLEPEKYGPVALAALLDGSTPAELATLEILFSTELLHYAGDLKRGRINPARVDPKLFIIPDDFDRAAVLAGAANTKDIASYLAELAPDSTPYRRLRHALERYRGIEAHGGWPTLPDGPSLKKGMRDSRVPVLRERLIASGDLTEDTEPRTQADAELFDAEVESAVIHLQHRFGLDADGVVGPRTREQLNIPASERIEQIELNMERLRWLPDDLGKRHVHVNLAGFKLDLIEQDKTVLAMKVIVGRTYRQTPVFMDRITYMEINPNWTVPTSIARNDLIPKIRENPSYLEQNGFRVYAGWSSEAPQVDPAKIDWSAVDPRRMPYRFVQSPGPLNALGQIKFMFPNQFNVYLHDTPQRELFQKTVRTFSSGCIRVEHPLELARYLLENQPDWNMEKLKSAINSGKRQTVRLSTPVPVHLIYATAWVDEDGVINFRSDIYGRDTLLRMVL